MSARNPGGALVAHYWNGGAPSPRTVSNVSVDGAYIEAPDKWYPGTVITLIFQHGGAAAASPGQGASTAGELPTCTVRAVVVRSVENGFAVKFRFGDHRERAEFQEFLRQALKVDGPGVIPPLGRGQAAGH